MTDIVLIHGMWCRPRHFEAFRRPLEAAGHTVHVPTLVYHDTDPAERAVAAIGGTSIASYAVQVAEFARQLDRPLLVGHSMGGLIAQLAAERVDVRGVVALATAPPGNFFAVQWSNLWIFLPALLRYGFWYKPQRLSWRRARRGVLQNLEEEEARAIYDTLVWESGRALAEVAFGWTRFSRAAWIDPAATDAPMLFVTGSDDLICPWPAAERTAALQSATFEKVEGMAHWLIAEPGWEAIAERVLDFEREVSARGARSARSG